MAMSEREIWYTTAVTEEPQVASFRLPFGWNYQATVSAPGGSGSHSVMWAGLTR